MRIIAESTLKRFWLDHADAQGTLEAWRDDVRRADWSKPADVQERYGADAILNAERAVFNIRGNKYRMVVKINYNARIVFIRFIGTYAEYDRIDAITI